jgi:hypothetical protein
MSWLRILNVEMIRRFYFSVQEVLLKVRNPRLSQSFRVKSHLTTEERVALNRLASGKKTILEIGSYVGASACCFGAELKKSGFGRVFCIDTWNNDAMTEGGQDTYTEFLKNTESFEQFIIPIRGFSTDVVKHIATKTNHVDLLFIDGDHSYNGVKADWDAYKGFLKVDSFVVLHDWGWAEGVRRVILEDATPFVSSIGSLPNMWWGRIGQIP